MDICDNNLYYIGGIVRDELLGVNKHFDIDLTYQGDAIEFAKIFQMQILYKLTSLLEL